MARQRISKQALTLLICEIYSIGLAGLCLFMSYQNYLTDSVGFTNWSHANFGEFLIKYVPKHLLDPMLLFFISSSHLQCGVFATVSTSARKNAKSSRRCVD